VTKNEYNKETTSTALSLNLIGPDATVKNTNQRQSKVVSCGECGDDAETVLQNATTTLCADCATRLRGELLESAIHD